jgi:hypothetical protein
MVSSSVVDQSDIPVVIHEEMEAVRRNVAALRDAIRSLAIGLTPNVVKAVAQQERRREALAAEFGLRTSVEAGTRMGSRASAARRNAAAAARGEGRLLAYRQGRYLLYPGSSSTTAESARSSRS